jgi:hypothetical protein
MKIELVHPFWKNYPEAVMLYRDNCRMKILIDRIVMVANQISENPAFVNFKSGKTEPNDINNEFRGSAFEAFGEIFIKLFGMMPQIGISNYVPNTDPDYGVDGKGVGKSGNPVTTQFKFREDPRGWLFADKDHLDNFVAASQEMGVTGKNSMTIFTTNQGVSYKDMTRWEGKVKYISLINSSGTEIGQNLSIFSLKSMVNNNLPFWQTAIELIENSSKA